MTACFSLIRHLSMVDESLLATGFVMHARLGAMEANNAAIDAGRPTDQPALSSIKLNLAIPDSFQQPGFDTRIIDRRQHSRVNIDHHTIVANGGHLIPESGADRLSRPPRDLDNNFLWDYPAAPNTDRLIGEGDHHQVTCI
jgi:hypothetical protein